MNDTEKLKKEFSEIDESLYNLNSLLKLIMYENFGEKIELLYSLIDDKEKFSQILKSFGGISIEFPTVEEFKSAITLALVYYYKEVMHYSWDKIETLIDYERDIGLRYGSKIKKLNKSIKKQLDKVSNSVDKPKEIFEI